MTSVESFHLCRVQTEDGLLLDGAASIPTGASEGFVLVHGTGSHFAAPGILETFAQQAVASGRAAVRINTRGHDGIASTPGQRGPGGATYETVSDCVLDLAAWINFLKQAGVSRIVLVGHSMGGVKSIYSQSQNPDASVAGIVCLSPPRFCHEHWMEHPGADGFRQAPREANSLVETGKGDELIHCRQPLSMLMTARGFVEKYGPEDHYDIIRLLPAVSAPVLILVGSRTLTASPAFDSLPEAIERLTESGRAVTCHVVDGADMSYRQAPKTPFQLYSDWLHELASFTRP